MRSTCTSPIAPLLAVLICCYFWSTCTSAWLACPVWDFICIFVIFFTCFSSCFWVMVSMDIVVLSYVEYLLLWRDVVSITLIVPAPQPLQRGCCSEHGGRLFQESCSCPSLFWCFIQFMRSDPWLCQGKENHKFLIPLK
jgi:hypothetical protein